jgi:hypothetical protein
VWTDTQIDLGPSDAVTVNATESAGNCHSAGSGATAPDLTLPSAAPGALIAKIGSDDATAFLVGPKKTWTVDQPGRLSLGLNQAGAAPCNGNLSVEISVTKGSYGQQMMSKAEAAAASWLEGQFGIGKQPATTGSNTAAGGDKPAQEGTPYVKPTNISSASLDADLCRNLESAPRRVNDQLKNLGDMVNFVIVGSQQQMQTALTAANWHVADTSNTGAVIAAIEATMEKKDYLAMPMSTLYLYDRKQDFGYEQAEAIAMVASRHHFRVWKAPFTYQGQTVWLGAGTHDIGFEKDQRNGNVTHKIDPAVDGERDNIGGTLQQTGRVKSLTYYLPTNPVQATKNATGGEYHSDGRLLVIFL